MRLTAAGDAIFELTFRGMQDAQTGSMIVSGVEGYDMEDPRAKMDLLRYMIDVSWGCRKFELTFC